MKFVVEALLLGLTVVYAIDSTTPYTKHIPLAHCERVCKGIIIVLPISRVSLVDKRHNEPNPTLMSHCEKDCKRKLTFEELYDAIFEEYHKAMQHDLNTCKDATIRFLKAVGVQYEKRDVVTVCDDLVHKKNWEYSWLRSLIMLAAKDPDNFWKKNPELPNISNFLKKPINRHLQLCKEHVFATFQIIYSRHPKMTEVKWHKRNVPKTMVGSKSPDCLVILEGYTENLHKAFKFKLGYAETLFKTVYNRDPNTEEKDQVREYLSNNQDNSKWFSKVLDFIISMFPDEKIIMKKSNTGCPPKPDVHIKIKSSTCNNLMGRCYNTRSEIRLNGGENVVPAGILGHVCVAFNKIVKNHEVHWEKEVIVVDTMHSDHGMVWSGSSLKPWTDKLPNNSIVACVIQGEGARFSAQLMDALVPFGVDYTEVTFQEPWLFLGYKGGDTISMEMKRNGWLPWITTLKAQQGTGPVEIKRSFNSKIMPMCDTEFTCDRKPDGSYPNVEEKSPKCYYMMCIDQEMFCTPCPMHDDKMMFFDSTTNKCVPQKEN